MTSHASAAVQLTPSSRRWLIAYCAVATVDIIAEFVFAHWVAFAAVVLAMPFLALVLIMSGRRGRTVWLVLVSLAFSWLGDWVGDLVPSIIIVKIVFFFIAHIFFLLAFWPYRRNSILFRPGYLVAFSALVAGLLVWIAPHAGELAPALVAYGALLGLMAVLATGVHRLAAIGGMIFVSSDMSIALSAFVFTGMLPRADVVIMSTYLAAQGLIVLGVIGEGLTVPKDDPAQRSGPSTDGAQH